MPQSSIAAALAHRRPRLLLAIAIGVAATVITWAVLGSYNDRPVAGSQAATPSANGATAISPQQLPALARSVRHPIYWAPRAPYSTLALIRLSAGGVQLRYLPSGVSLNSPSPAYLVIGSYPIPSAFSVVAKLAAEPGASVDHIAGGAVAVIRRSVPHSVYLAYPRSSVEIEVYDPSIAVARRLVRGGQLRAVTG